MLICRSDRMRPRSKKHMERALEAVLLRAHTADTTTLYSVPVAGVPDCAASGVEDGFLQISSAEMTAIFAPTVDEITALAARQVESVENDGLRVVVCSPACVTVECSILIWR